MIIYPSNLPEQLDFTYILSELEVFCHGKKAKELAKQLIPISNEALIKTNLNETGEFLLSIHHDNSIPLKTYPEIDKEAHLLSIENSVLNGQQFNQIRHCIQIYNELIHFFSDKEDVFPYLIKKIHSHEKDTFVIDTINEIIDKDAIIKDDASEELKSIRKRIGENRKSSDRAYRIHIQRLKKLGHLADFEESYVNGRRVLGILAEHKREFKGITLSQSSSGKITFIEPQNVIELNNEKLELEDEEKKEIYRILKTLTGIVRPFHSYIYAAYQLLIQFDFTGAKARLAKSLNATLPIITSDKTTIKLVNAFHPVLLLQNSKNNIQTQPIHCEFNEANRIMVISGPNAGGKSITLKTIGLLQIMLQCGLLIPASAKSEMSIKHKLFGDIGDNQSIEDGLSTYSSRLLKMKHFLKHTDHRTLFLIDEFGTGSDPDMGGAMAEIILNKLNELKAQGVVTTHFTNLKLLANTNEGIYNACMLFNTKTLKPLYQLHIGEPGSSFTFEVAEKIGLPVEIIQEAKLKLSNEKVSMDKLLNQLQSEKNVIAKLKRDLQKQLSKTTAEKREFQSLTEQLETTLENNKANKEEKQKLIEYGKKLHQLTQEWAASKDKKPIIHKFVKLAGYELAKKKEQEEYERTEKFKSTKIEAIKHKLEIGSKVRMLKSKETGVVLTLKENRAIVLFGKVKMNVGLEKLEIA
jgi:DNA mismatch repair protein MutS2